MPECIVVLELGGCKRQDRSLAEGLQREPASQGVEQPGALGVCGSTGKWSLKTNAQAGTRIQSTSWPLRPT